MLRWGCKLKGLQSEKKVLLHNLRVAAENERKVKRMCVPVDTLELAEAGSHYLIGDGEVRGHGISGSARLQFLVMCKKTGKGFYIDGYDESDILFGKIVNSKQECHHCGKAIKLWELLKAIGAVK